MCGCSIAPPARSASPNPGSVSSPVLGAFGGAYLTGLFLLVAAIVLTLFGPPAGRRYARLAGLGVGGAVLGVVGGLVHMAVFA